MISVFLCDAQPILLEGLRAVLNRSQDYTLAGWASTLEQASVQIEEVRPSIVIVDRGFGMHVLLEWVADLRRRFPKVQIVIWAAGISDVECFRALQSGARGIVRKTAAIPALFHCLDTVVKNEIWTENLFERQDSPLGRPRTRPLTPREQQVAELVSKGMKNREIAETLQIATGTVKIHLMHIFEKTGIRDRFELALQGLRLACERDGQQASVDPETSPAVGTHPSLKPAG